MLERDMEDLVANYPDDFFPGRGFELRGRQQSFAGVGRFDLLFEDRFKTKILMELKAVSARYEVATQLAKYKDELRSRGESDILMWLVAPQIPNSVREFLDRIGIEYSEIHVAEFQRVANRHDFPTRAEVERPVEPVNPADTQRAKVPPNAKRRSKERILFKSREFIAKTIHQLWSEQRDWVTREQLIGQLNKQAWTAERLDAQGLVDPNERQRRVGNWVDWFSAEYTSGKFDLKGKFEQDEVDGTWAYRPRQGAN
jgi:hypothetical protein